LKLEKELDIRTFIRSVDHIDDYKRLIRELTGMELCINKCTLLLSGGPPTQAVRDKAADKNIAIARTTETRCDNG
jgi:hypothetical protein